MKKIIILFFMALVVLQGSVYANEKDNQQNIIWEMSMLPKPSAEEQEAARWSLVLENNMGIYAYDIDSFTFPVVVNGIVDKNIISVLTKTLFTDKEILKKLNMQYAEKLAKKEKVQYCEITMTFNLLDKTYGVSEMLVYGNKKTLLQHTKKDLQMVKVPTGSFAEAMMNICQEKILSEKNKVTE